MKVRIFERIMTLSQDDEKFDVVTTYVPKAPKSSNVAPHIVAVPALPQSHVQLVTNDVPGPLESTVPVPVPMPIIDNSVFEMESMSPSPHFKPAPKKKRQRRGW